MAKDTRLGDTMPDTRDPKWGAMKAGDSYLSEKWHTLDACDPKFSEKWDHLGVGTPRMSEKWVEMNAGEPKGDQWHEMKQEKRDDPYSMAPASGDRTVGMKQIEKEAPDNKRQRWSANTEFGRNREI